MGRMKREERKKEGRAKGIQLLEVEKKRKKGGIKKGEKEKRKGKGSVMDKSGKRGEKEQR